MSEVETVIPVVRIQEFHTFIIFRTEFILLSRKRCQM